MMDYSGFITSLQAMIDAETDERKKQALQAQLDDLMEMQLEVDVDDVEEIPFDTDDYTLPSADQYPSLESLGAVVLSAFLSGDTLSAEDVVRKLAPELTEPKSREYFLAPAKVASRPVDEITALGDTYTEEHPDLTMPQRMNQLVRELQEANASYDAFMTANKRLMDEKSELSFARTLAERKLYGLLMRSAEQGVRISQTGYDWTLVSTLDYDVPSPAGFSLKYELDPAPDSKRRVVISDEALIEWCYKYRKGWLRVDADSAESGIKQWYADAQGERTQERNKEDAPPAKVVAKVLPTVGKVTYDDMLKTERQWCVSKDDDTERYYIQTGGSEASHWYITEKGGVTLDKSKAQYFSGSLKDAYKRLEELGLPKWGATPPSENPQAVSDA